MINVPVLLLIGSKSPGWLTEAWQVSGVLVGLVIAFMVFQLQSLGTQNVRTADLYRTALGHTLLMWPLTSAMVFVAAVAFATRFDSTHAPPPLLETLALASFCFQPVAVLVTLRRLVAIASPEATADLMRAAIADRVRRSVTSQIRRAFADEIWEEALHDASLAVRPFSLEDQWAHASPGRLVDISRRLPRALHRADPSRGITSHAHLDDHSARGVSLLAAPGFSPKDLRLIERGVAVRKRPDDESHLPLVEEALQLALEAAVARRLPALDESLQLVAEFYRQVELAHRSFKLSASIEQRVHRYRPGISSEISHEIVRFTQEVAREHNPQLDASLVAFAYEVALDGVDLGSSWLVQQGVALFKTQTTRAYERGTTANDWHALIASDAGELARSLMYMLSHAPNERRDETEKSLNEPIALLGWLLKEHAGHDELSRFDDAWRQLTRLSTLYPTDEDLEDLETELSLATGAQEKEATERQLTELRRERWARDTATGLRALTLAQVGGWLLYRARRKKLGLDRWSEFATYLVGAFATRQEILKVIASGKLARGNSVMARWDDENGDPNAQTGWLSGASDAAIQDWLALLFIKMSPPGAGDELDAGEAALLASAGQLLESVNRLQAEAGPLNSVVGHRATEQANQAREDLEQAINAAKAATIAAVRASPLDPNTVDSFRTQQLESFDEANDLRHVLVEAGSVRDDVGVPPIQGLWTEHLSKFNLGHRVPRNPLGVRSAYRYQEAVFERLRQEAVVVPNESVAGVREAIHTLRARGCTPAVFVERGVRARATLSPHLVWAARGSREIATLDDASVYGVGPLNAGFALIFDPADVRVSELRSRDALPGLEIDVKVMNKDQLEKLFRDDPAVDTQSQPILVEQQLGLQIEATARLGLEVAVRDERTVYLVRIKEKRLAARHQSRPPARSV